MSKSEQARSAVNARWTRTREQRQDEDSAIVPAAPASHRALVQFDPEDLPSNGTMVSFARSFRSTLESTLAVVPVLRKDPDLAIESHIVRFSTRVLSASVQQEMIGVPRKTIQQRQRLLAGTLVLARRRRAFDVMETMHHYIMRLPGSRALMAVQIEKYDGVTFRVNVDKQDRDSENEEGEAGNPEGKRPKDCVVTKLLNVSVTYACL